MRTEGAATAAQSGRGAVARRADWIARQGDRSAKPQLRLFCFHHAGGSSSVFNEWQAMLDPRIEVCAVRLPGRGVRFGEPLLSDMNELVSAALAGLLPHMDVPFAFFGHSMGALLAYELTQRLQAGRRALPAALAVSARPAPDVAIAERFRTASRLPDQQLLELLAEASTDTVRAFEDQALRELLLPIVRADFRVCESWQPRRREPLGVAVIAFAGEHDPWVPAEAVERWKLHTLGKFTWRLLEGDHFLFQSCAAEICGTLQRELIDLAPGSR